MEVLTLDYNGVAVALVMAFAFLFFGGGIWYFFIAVMLLFLIMSALTTMAGAGRKKRLGLYQKPRGIRNVVANGAVPLAMAMLYAALTGIGNSYAPLALIAFTASVAAITADKFGSEIGVLGGRPVMLLGMRKVQAGTSGAVSVTGVIASLAASAMIAFAVFVVWGHLAVMPILLVAVPAITVSGFVGGLVDSMLGYYEERGIGSKYTSNLFCALAGAALAVALILL